MIIVNCFPLQRNTNGTSKRCAFLTYTTTKEAQLAIEKMNNCSIVKGTNQHLVVKIADTPKEKEQRKLEKRLQNAALQLRKLVSHEAGFVFSDLLLKVELSIESVPFHAQI